MILRGKHAFRRQFDLGGIIRVGGEQSKGEWNRELDHFRLTSEDPNIQAAEKLVGEYGNAPKSLHVMLPSDDPEEVFDDNYELWKGSRKANVKGVLLCRGNGLQAERIIDPENPWERETVVCPCPENCSFALEHTSDKVKKDGGSACGACGRLRIICYRVSILEVYEIRTGSINAFQGLRNKLLEIHSNPFVGGEGRLMGIPLLLVREPKKNRFGKTNYPCRLVVPSWEEWQRETNFIGKVADAIAAPMRRIRELANVGPLKEVRSLPMPPDGEAIPDELVPKSQKLPPRDPPQTKRPRPELVKAEVIPNDDMESFLDGELGADPDAPAVGEDELPPAAWKLLDQDDPRAEAERKASEAEAVPEEAVPAEAVPEEATEEPPKDGPVSWWDVP